MLKTLKIGVMGCANIAKRSFIPAIKALPSNYQLIAVASRSYEKSKIFAEQFCCDGVVGYDKLISIHDIDAIYVPLPTGLHKEWIIKALNAGKHVYAEKSIAMNYLDAKEMVQIAKENDRVLMEGYMFQYHLQHSYVKDLLKGGAVGEIRHFSSSFGFPPMDRTNFRYDAEIGGGAIMDCAGYTVRAVFFLLGSNFRVQGASVFYDPNTGASLYGSAFMKSDLGIGASLAFGFDNFYQCSYRLWGSKGRITATKAFTAKPFEAPPIILENGDGYCEIKTIVDNHFVKALLEFYSIIINTGRDIHYKQILEQSEALQNIKDYSILG
jgi:dTDP-3,4-didehydro-2,6-dideoxy-alpha-D-glucose 3-reductase